MSILQWIVWSGGAVVVADRALAVLIETYQAIAAWIHYKIHGW